MPTASNIAPPPPPKRRQKFPWILFLVAIFSTWFAWESLNPKLPEQDAPPKLYSNQCQQDIASTLLAAIDKAKTSVHLVMFGLSERSILRALSKKIKENIPTTVYYDVTGSPKVYRYLKGGEIHPIKKKGLMHQKILVLDHETVFIGSANMTHSSLRMHDNLVIGLVSKPLGEFLEKHKPYTPGYYQGKVGGQEIELWLLPDPRGHALTELRKKIRTAQKSIRIALFTFTHPTLVEEVIQAHNRGVTVSVVIDMHSSFGASRKAVEKLKGHGVPIYGSTGTQLLHHKFVYIDEKHLITGSANWTKSALYKNSDCILALNNLTSDQIKFMNKLWFAIETSTK